MSMIFVMSDIVYRGTLPENGRVMRDLLVAYCSSRFRTSVQEPVVGSSRHWDENDEKALAMSQQVGFIADVMCKV